MNRAVGKVRFCRWWTRLLCRTGRRSWIIANSWSRCMRFLMGWVWRSVEGCSGWSLRPWWTGWAIIILRVEVKQPSKAVI